MKAITNTSELIHFLQGLADRRASACLHRPRGGQVYGTIFDMTASRVLRFEADGEPPRPGASVQLTGVHEGGAFGFVADYLGSDADAWLIAAPYRIDVRQRRQRPRAKPMPGMMLRLAIGGRHYEADLADLSEGGLGFSTGDLPFELRVGARLEGRLDLSLNRFVPVHLEVTHVHAAGAGARILSCPEPAVREIRSMTTRKSASIPEITLR